MSKLLGSTRVLACLGPFIFAGAFLGAAFVAVLVVLLLIFAISHLYFLHNQLTTDICTLFKLILFFERMAKLTKNGMNTLAFMLKFTFAQHEKRNSRNRFKNSSIGGKVYRRPGRIFGRFFC
jgi:hypothetical protein